MYNSIERGEYPSWTMMLQVMDPKEAETYKWNIFDITKIWPHKDYPLMPVGKLTLNKNPENHFHDLDPWHRTIRKTYGACPETAQCEWTATMALTQTTSPCSYPATFSSEVTDEDWEQPRNLWKLFKENGDDDKFIHNLSGHVNKALPEVQKDTIRMWAKVDEDISKRLEKDLNEKKSKVDHQKAPPSQTALARRRK
ncbi:hypothetical protein S40288_05537 [Stachybotrys chartarum IBT 40288]|nr:hypothetical protein S40288_05537 [Stachybotrys chartarum IBT 40288]